MMATKKRPEGERSPQSEKRRDGRPSLLARVDEEILWKIRALAVRHRRTQNEEINEGLRQWIAKCDEEEGA